MEIHRILFPEPNRAELVTETLPDQPGPGQVLYRTSYTTISPGTERANITGDPNVAGTNAPSVKFPRGIGYSSSGVVMAVGEGVTALRPGDRVIGYWSKHADYNMLPLNQVIRIPDGGIGMREAAAVFCADFFN